MPDLCGASMIAAIPVVDLGRDVEGGVGICAFKGFRQFGTSFAQGCRSFDDEASALTSS